MKPGISYNNTAKGRISTMFRTLLAVLIFMCLASTTLAGSFADGVSDATGPAVALGIAAAYFTTGEQGKENASRLTDAVLISYGISKILKPNLSVNDDGYEHTFPSGHTAIAFAAASSLAEIHPKQKWYYYAGAALIGWSRVETDAHTWRDVLGGTALGITMGKWSINSSEGLMIGRVYRF